MEITMNRYDRLLHDGRPAVRMLPSGAIAMLALSCAEAPLSDGGDASSLTERDPSALTTVAGADPAASVPSSSARLASDQAAIGPRPQIAPSGPPAERPAVLSREFACRSDQVGQEMRVGEVAGRPGAGIFIRPQGTECQFGLVHRAADGREVPLSESPGGYLFSAGQVADGRAVVCTNDIRHVAVGRGDGRTIEEVVIACAAERPDGSWTSLVDVVTPDGEWAAWLREVVPAPNGGVAIRWARDFSFSVLNMTDAGRPPEDGLYETVVSVSGEAPEGIGTQKISDRSNPLSGAEFKPWKPTDEEKESLSDYIDFDEGPCRGGCAAPDAPQSPELPNQSTLPGAPGTVVH
jgi:hypothetical protein